MKNLFIISIAILIFSCSNKSDPTPAMAVSQNTTAFDYKLHYNVFQVNGGQVKSIRQDSCFIWHDGTNIFIQNDTADYSKHPDLNQFSFQGITNMINDSTGVVLAIQLNPYSLGKNIIKPDASKKNIAQVDNFDQPLGKYYEKMSTTEESYIDFTGIDSTFIKAEYFINLVASDGTKKLYHGKMYIDLSKQGNNIGL